MLACLRRYFLMPHSLIAIKNTTVIKSSYFVTFFLLNLNAYYYFLLYLVYTYAVVSIVFYSLVTNAQIILLSGEQWTKRKLKKNY